MSRKLMGFASRKVTAFLAGIVVGSGEEASGPDGITIKGRFLADLFATYELTPDPDREYPCELKGHVGETVTFNAKVPA